VPISAPYSITNCRRFFAEPATPRQRQYEALRAFYLEGLTSAHAAARFGYSPGAFRVLCHAFRRGELPEFFAATRPGPRDQPKKSAAQERIIALRKRNYSVYDISRALKQQGTPLSATAVREVLAAQGFKVDFDMTLLVLASGLYRLMASRMRGHDDAQARLIFRDLIDMPADVAIADGEISVRFHRRAHLPIVLASGILDKPIAVPWWHGYSLRFVQHRTAGFQR